MVVSTIPVNIRRAYFHLEESAVEIIDRARARVGRPWRQAQREGRQREFIASFLLGSVAIFLCSWFAFVITWFSIVNGPDATLELLAHPHYIFRLLLPW